MTDIPSSDREQEIKRVERAKTTSTVHRTDDAKQSKWQTATEIIYVNGKFVSGRDFIADVYDREEIDERLRIS